MLKHPFRIRFEFVWIVEHILLKWYDEPVPLSETYSTILFNILQLNYIHNILLFRTIPITTSWFEINKLHIQI